MTEKHANDEIESYIKQIQKLKQSNMTSLIEIGKICKEAKSNLSQKDFKNFLKDSRVNYKLTQAKKFINVYIYSQKSQSTDHILELGIEKIYQYTRLKDKTKRQEFHSFLCTRTDITVNKLKHIVKLLNNNPKLSVSYAVEQVLNAPPKKVVKLATVLKEYEELKNKYEKLLMAYKNLENGK